MKGFCIGSGCLATLFLVVMLPSEGFADNGPGARFLEIQTKLIERFDQDGNGRLDASEREGMRQTVAAEALEEQEGGDKGLPTEFIEKHDANKNGKMDDPEWGPAIEKEVAVIVKRFDADGSGKLDKTERAAVRESMKKGEYEGVYGYFAGRASEDPEAKKRRRGGGPSYLAKSQELLKFDRDGDGVASREELQAIRESRSKKAVESADVK